jgi:hypothetical protein
MDALVAEKVMGWVDCKPNAITRLSDDYDDVYIGLGTNPSGRKRCVCPPYSTSISAAWEVVEHFRNRQWTAELKGHEWYVGGRWECILIDALGNERARGAGTQRHSEKKRGWDEPSAPLAICRAALKAVEVEKCEL